MLTQVVAWTVTGLLGVLILRGVYARTVARYPVFYFYLSYVLFESLVRAYSYYNYYFSHPSVYAAVFWYTQVFSLALGYCVIWEVYRQALADYPGVARLGYILLAGLFLLVVAQGFSEMFGSAAVPTIELPALLERSLRTIQALLLVAIVALLVYYQIPLGRNLRGLVVGYGLFVGASVVSLTLRAYWGYNAEFWNRYVPPLAYLFALVIWTAALWSYHPNPRPQRVITLERDYKLLAAQVENAIARTRASLLKAVRP